MIVLLQAVVGWCVCTSLKEADVGFEIFNPKKPKITN